MILAPQNCQCPIIEEGASIANSPVCSGTHMFMILLQGYLWGQCNIAEPCKRITSIKEPDEEYDFIVVGAGSAGSIVAARLSEDDNKYKVILLEAGGPDPIASRVPGFYRNFWGDDEVDWNFRTVPSDYCLDQGTQGCQWIRGKVLGGSSVLNGMMFHKGHAADYEDWVNLGAQGWSWDEMRPFMDMVEGNKQIGDLVEERYHSATGRMPIQTFNYQPAQVLDLLEAINSTGLPVIKDMSNPETPEGFSVAQTFNENGQRYTTARAYLVPTSLQPNLHYKLKAHVTKVLFDSKKAVGVEYIDENGKTKTIKANKEIILCAGALQSPQILMLSGVGPAETLEALEIPVIADLPVGKNLKNHYGGTLYFTIKKVNNTEVLNWKALMDYMLQRQGPMSATGLTQLTGLLYSSFANKTRGQPDLQFFFNGLYAECSKTGMIGEPVEDCSNSNYNVTANAVSLLPRSVGYLTINTTNPLEPPLFFPNYFAHPDDMKMIKEALIYVKKIFDSDLLKEKYNIELNKAYTKQCKDFEDWSDAWQECMIRYYTDAQNHQLGTCSIGQVVDADLNVYGLQNLRVSDASVMPSQPTGNPQGAIMAVAEKCAHLIKQTWQ